MEVTGFKLGRQIKSTHQWTAYNALDTGQSKTVLVKVYNETLSDDPIFQTQFQAIAARLTGKELGSNLNILNTQITDGKCLLITNYCTYSTKKPDGGQYAEDELVLIGAQLAENLSLLHQNGVIHGRVNMENIYFPKTGGVVLDTPDLARNIPLEGALPTVDDLDRLTYLAPESNTEQTRASDFFSLGTVIYELLTGDQPYDANTMLHQKHHGEFKPLNENQLHLKPLIEGLLSPDPSIRISSHDEYMSRLAACRGVSAIQLKSAKISPIKDIGAGISPDISGQKSSDNRNIMITVVVGLVVLGIVTGALVLSTDEISPTATDAQSPPPPPTQTTSPAPEDQNQTNGYTRAYNLYSQGQYEAAIKALDTGPIDAADGVRALKLRRDINDAIKVESLLSQAKYQINSGQLITPEGDNALETYLILQSMSDADDQRITKGIQSIADAYHFKALQLLDQNELDAADEAIADGFSVLPDYQPLIVLSDRLEQARQAEIAAIEAAKRAEQERLHAAKLEKNRRTANKYLNQAKIQLNQNQLDAARTSINKGLAVYPGYPPLLDMKKQLTAKLSELAALQEAKRQEQERIQAARLAEERRIALENEHEKKVQALLISTTDMLADPSLSSSSLNQAVGHYHQLQELAPSDQRLQGLYTKIVNAHISLATEQKNTSQLEASMQTVEQGLELETANPALLSLHQDILDAQTAKKTEKKIKVPVFGTF